MERALARHPTMRERVFTVEERAYCDRKARPAESYAGRFAAREATIKALGGYRGKRWQDIHVSRHPSGAPVDRPGGQREAPRRHARDHEGLGDVHAREDERGRVRGGGRRVKPVLTPDQAATLDRETQARGIPAELLMERAGRAVARSAVDVMGGAYGRRAVVVCGKGNNGGDGFVAARHLARWGVRVAVVARGGPGRPPRAGRGATRSAWTRSDVDPRDARSRPRRSIASCARADVAIDAVFGTGFRGVPEDEWADAIAGLNTSPAPVVAVDIPSGVERRHRRGGRRRGARGPHRDVRRAEGGRGDPAGSRAGRGGARRGHRVPPGPGASGRVPDGARRRRRGPARTGHRHAQARDRGAASWSRARAT